MPVSAIILSGGRATRMNGVDKGLVILQNQPLIAHVIARLQPQVDEILINANRELAAYKTFGYRVLQDEADDFPGPLAGFLLGLKHAKHAYVLTVPCDSPMLPPDLVQRLYQGMLEANAEIAVAKTDDDTHQVFCLMRKSILPSLEVYLASGGRKVKTWQQNQQYVEVAFSDCNAAFTNLNTFEDLKTLELGLGS